MTASTPRPPPWPILIAGGGIASLALALALRQAAGPAVAVTVVDPGHASPGNRAYALGAGSRAMLETLGVWPRLVGSAQPIRAMRITDSRLRDAVRPDYLRFRDEDDALGSMHEAGPLAAVLGEAARAAGVVFLSGTAEARAASDGRMRVHVEGEERPTALLVAADGARSRLREAAGIGWLGRRYGQTALVATIAHARNHQGVAIQHFLPAGPFAILPLAGAGEAFPHRSSVVWTEETETARRLLADEERADEALAARFGPELGDIRRETPLAGFPLGIGIARSFVAARFALLGDAAHEIHPLAGQGLNLGLADAAALAEAVVDAVRLGLDPGCDEILARYQRARRFDATLLATLTDGLNRLFSNDVTALRMIRDLGLGLVERSPLRRALAAQASGAADRAPRLMRGEAL